MNVELMVKSISIIGSKIVLQSLGNDVGQNYQEKAFPSHEFRPSYVFGPAKPWHRDRI